MLVYQRAVHLHVMRLIVELLEMLGFPFPHEPKKWKNINHHREIRIAIHCLWLPTGMNQHSTKVQRYLRQHRNRERHHRKPIRSHQTYPHVLGTKSCFCQSLTTIISHHVSLASSSLIFCGLVTFCASSNRRRFNSAPCHEGMIQGKVWGRTQLKTQYP